MPLCGCLCPRSLSGGLACSSNQLQPPSSQAALTGLCEQQPVFREGLVLAPSLPASELALQGQEPGLPAPAATGVIGAGQCVKSPAWQPPGHPAPLPSSQADPAPPAPRQLPPLQYLEVRAFPPGLRPSMVLGSRFRSPVSGHPRPPLLPEDPLQASAAASRSFHACFLFFASLYFPLRVTLPEPGPFLCLPSFFSPFSPG